MRNPAAAGRWRALGRLLPRDVRERIFEPAFADLMRNRLTGKTAAARSLPFGVWAVGTFLGCVPAAASRVVRQNGHLTRFGKLAVVAVAVLAVLGAAAWRMAQGYAALPPSP